MRIHRFRNVTVTLPKNAWIKVKNPWAKDRFKGPWSPYDTNRWTKELMTELNYDIHKARDVDDGIFWIDYNLSRYVFENMYLAWRPDKLFANSTIVHSKWDNSNSPVKDRYFLTKNPQYRLSIRNVDKSKTHGGTGTPIWLLLTRHITDLKDFEDNSVYLALMIFKGGKRLYSKSMDPSGNNKSGNNKPVFDGIRINSPHYLVKLKPEPGINDYTIVITQYENRGKSSYSLTSYSVAGVETELSKIGDLETNYPVKQIYKGEWTAQTAGGCSNFRETYNKNPKIQFKLTNDSKFICIQLKAPKEYCVGFTVRSLAVGSGTAVKKDTGDYHHGFCYLELENVSSGVYEIVPTTFNPGEKGHFHVEINACSGNSVSFGRFVS